MELREERCLHDEVPEPPFRILILSERVQAVQGQTQPTVQKSHERNDEIALSIVVAAVKRRDTYEQVDLFTRWWEHINYSSE